jgi:hypothetical protein
MTFVCASAGDMYDFPKLEFMSFLAPIFIKDGAARLNRDSPPLINPASI